MIVLCCPVRSGYWGFEVCEQREDGVVIGILITGHVSDPTKDPGRVP